MKRLVALLAIVVTTFPSIAANQTSIQPESQAERFIAEPRPSQGQVRPASLTNETTIPTSSAFLLHSRPGSKRVIYLDFDGYDLTGTKWSTQSEYAFTANNKNLEPFDQDGNTASFSDSELRAIIEAWSSVAEDYAIFDVDVTTVQPSEDAQWKTSDLDDTFGVIAAVTTENNPISPVCGCGGIAWSKVFDRTWRSYNGLSKNYVQPALVFTQSFYPGRVIGDIVSHEVGHNLGLYHDGHNNPVVGYYHGREGWGPIMGSPYEMPLSTWSIGDYQWANQLQDDVSEIVRYGLPLLADDYGNSTAKAKSIKSVSQTAGLINSRADLDYFSFTATKTQTNVSVFSNSVSTNLDLKLSVFDSTGKLVRIDNQPFVKVTDYTSTGLDANLKLATKPGSKYFISIDGVGQGDPAVSGYSDYGSLGGYVLKLDSVTLPAITNGAISLTGLNLIGSTLTANTGTWPNGTILQTQWLRNGVLQSSTGNTYMIQPQDQGSTITLNVLATLDGFKISSVISAGVKVVGAISPAPTPIISGKAKVGATLTAKTGTWKTGVTKSYQWFRDGVAIANQTGDTYIVTLADQAKKITVKVTGTLSGYNNLTKTSISTSKVLP